MKSHDKQNRRLILFFGCFLGATLFLLGKLFYMSVMNKKDYTTYTPKVAIPRGIIYDSKMREIALNVPSYTIYLDKEAVSNKNMATTESNIMTIYDHIPDILGMTESEFIEKISPNRRTVTLARNTTLETYQKIIEAKNEFNIRSIYGVETYTRFYPYGDVFAHIIGYMNKNGTEGYTGLEASYESVLSSYNDNPENIVLTLDRDVQTIVRNEVLKIVTKIKVQSATVIVSDVNTGAIIANYSYPSFDPNNPFIYNNGERLDRSIMSTIYPASAMKIFTLLAALELGVSNIDEVFNCIGYYDYSERTRIHCDRPHGRVVFQDILRYSCNYSVVTISERLGKKFFYDYLKRFGFGEITGVGPYENEWSGIYHPLNKWHNFSRGYLSIGYDLSTTPMQIAASYYPLLNGGIKKAPHVVSSIFNDEKTLYMTNAQKNNSVIEPQYSQVARYLLRNGVVAGSTGAKANLVNIDVVGKTGTAITEVLKQDGNNRPRIEKYYQSLFIGGFPLEDPKISVLVLLDGPETDTSRAAGALVAPLFAKIVLQIIPYLGIIDNEVYNVDINNIESLIPKSIINTNDTMPNLTGMSLRDSLNTISSSVFNYDGKISIQGEGYIIDYIPKEGETITNNQVFYLMLNR